MRKRMRMRSVGANGTVREVTGVASSGWAATWASSSRTYSTDDSAVGGVASGVQGHFSSTQCECGTCNVPHLRPRDGRWLCLQSVHEDREHLRSPSAKLGSGDALECLDASKAAKKIRARNA